MNPAPLVEVEGLVKHFPVSRGLFRPREQVRAVDGVSFTIGRGEVVGLVGESGSGKTTVGRTLLRLTERTAGIIRFDGDDVTAARGAQMRALRRRMQIIFQDPYASLDPKQRVGQQIAAGFRIHGLHSQAERRARVLALLDRVGLRAEQADRFPHEFSGGQRQRIGIARALALEPEFIVADEAVSALDVSVQAQVVNLLLDLRQSLGLTLLFITHDLALVGTICDRVIVMYLGKVMEIAPTRALFANPLHPYTQALLSAIPTLEPGGQKSRIVLGGEVPSAIRPPSGCAFHTRCPAAIASCRSVVPELAEQSPGHFVRCSVVSGGRSTGPGTSPSPG